MEVSWPILISNSFKGRSEMTFLTNKNEIAKFWSQGEDGLKNLTFQKTLRRRVIYRYSWTIHEPALKIKIYFATGFKSELFWV